MANQINFTDMEYSQRKRKTKREEFLEIMNEITPWDEWVKLVEPYYPDSGKRGCQPKAIETMLRMLLLQSWFNLSDEGIEDTIYDSYAMKQFMGAGLYERTGTGRHHPMPIQEAPDGKRDSAKDI